MGVYDFPLSEIEGSFGIHNSDLRIDPNWIPYTNISNSSGDRAKGMAGLVFNADPKSLIPLGEGWGLIWHFLGTALHFRNWVEPPP